MGLALSADMVIASEGAKFVPAFMRVGLIPDFGLLYILPRIIGMRSTKEILFSSKTIGAEEGVDLGIVNFTVKENELETEAQKFALKMASNPPLAFAQAKSLMHTSYSIEANIY